MDVWTLDKLVSFWYKHQCNVIMHYVDLFPFLYHGQDIYRNWLQVPRRMADVLLETGTAYFSRAPAFITDLLLGSMLLIFLCCPFVCLYILSSVLSCALQFPHEKQLRSVFTSCCLLEGSGLYIVCVCLLIVLSNTCWVVSLPCLISSSVSYVAGFSGLLNLYWSFGIL